MADARVAKFGIQQTARRGRVDSIFRAVFDEKVRIAGFI
jgi:hypothetical protein